MSGTQHPGQNGGFHYSQNGGFQPGQMPQQSGALRALAFARRLSGGAIVLAGGIYLMQASLPAGWKPSDVIGGFEGGIHSSTWDVERRAQAETAARMAAIAAVNEGLTGEKNLAGLADVACIGGVFLNKFGGPSAYHLAHGMMGTCGMGDQIRSHIGQELMRAAR